MSSLVRLKPAGSSKGKQALFGLMDSPTVDRLVLKRAGDRVAVLDQLSEVEVGSLPKAHPIAKKFEEGRFRIVAYTVSGNPAFPIRPYLSVEIEETEKQEDA